MPAPSPTPARPRTADVLTAHAYVIPVVREMPRPATPLARGIW